MKSITANKAVAPPTDKPAAPAVQPEVSNFTAKDDDAFDDIVNFFRK